eukprot:Opistho-2@95802
MRSSIGRLAHWAARTWTHPPAATQTAAPSSSVVQRVTIDLSPAIQNAWRSHVLSSGTAVSSVVRPSAPFAALGIFGSPLLSNVAHYMSSVAEFFGFDMRRGNNNGRLGDNAVVASADGAALPLDVDAAEDAWSLENDDGRLYLQAPKKRTSHARSRKRMTGKYMKPKHVLTCHVCGGDKLPHRLCAACYNKTKDEALLVIRERVASVYKKDE